MAEHHAEGSTPPNTGNDALLLEIQKRIDAAMTQNRQEFERHMEDRYSHIPHVNNVHTHAHNDNNNNIHTSDSRGPEVGSVDQKEQKENMRRFKAFKDAGAKEFKGTETPIQASNWLDGIETVFGISYSLPTEKVKFATAMLTDDAQAWWKGKTMTLGATRTQMMAWPEFKVEFMSQYCSTDQRRRLEQEYRNLVQGDKTVTEYEQEFNRKASFVTSAPLTEEGKISQFVEGLRWEIMAGVKLQNPLTLASAVALARTQEEIIAAMPPSKRLYLESRFTPSSSGRSTAPGRSVPRNQRPNNRQCNRCGRRHTGPCNVGRAADSPVSRTGSSVVCYRCDRPGHTANVCPERTTTCYECGAVGHLRRNCPNLRATGNAASRPATTQIARNPVPPNQNRPRAFQITADEARASTEVVSGTFSVNGLSARVLFDTGATHSFVRPEFGRQIGAVCAMLSEPFVADSACGHPMATDSVYLDCILDLDGHQFRINLIPIDIMSFDVVVGMDWLSKNSADILCSKKMIRITTDSDPILIYGENKSGNVRLITSIHARRQMTKGCLSYLVYVIDGSSSRNVEISDVPVVSEYPDVFPDELPGIPPDRQVEFRIDNIQVNVCVL